MLLLLNFKYLYTWTHHKFFLRTNYFSKGLVLLLNVVLDFRQVIKMILGDYEVFLEDDKILSESKNNNYYKIKFKINIIK